MPSTNWGHIDNQPPLSKDFINNFSNNIARGLEFQQGGASSTSPKSVKVGQVYCLKCKTKVEVTNAKEVEMKNGGRRVAAKCVKCNGGVSKIIAGKKK